MTKQLLAAHTALDAPTYPPYTNISIDGGHVEITVRGPAVAHPSKRFQDAGATVTHRMSAYEFKRLIGEAVSNLILLEGRHA